MSQVIGSGAKADDLHRRAETTDGRLEVHKGHEEHEGQRAAGHSFFDSSKLRVFDVSRQPVQRDAPDFVIIASFVNLVPFRQRVQLDGVRRRK